MCDSEIKDGSQVEDVERGTLHWNIKGYTCTSRPLKAGFGCFLGAAIIYSLVNAFVLIYYEGPVHNVLKKSRDTQAEKRRFEQDFFQAKRDAHLWFQDLARYRGADLKHALEQDWADAPGPLSPYLVWNSTEGAFVCNSTNSDLFADRTSNSPEDSRPVLRLLAALESWRIPAILTLGSLLSFVRDCRLGTDDFDFVVFGRFLRGNVAAGEFAGYPGNGCCIGENITISHSLGTPGISGFELAYMVDVNGLSTKIDIWVAHEEKDDYEVGIWINGKPYSSSKPRPPTYVPAKHPSGARFFIPATALTELEQHYGPRWQYPYSSNYGERWHWFDSLRHFFGWNLSAVIPKNKTMRSHRNWDRTLEPLSVWRNYVRDRLHSNHSVLAENCSCRSVGGGARPAASKTRTSLFCWLGCLFICLVVLVGGARARG